MTNVSLDIFIKETFNKDILSFGKQFLEFVSNYQFYKEENVIELKIKTGDIRYE